MKKNIENLINNQITEIIKIKGGGIGVEDIVITPIIKNNNIIDEDIEGL